MGSDPGDVEASGRPPADSPAGAPPQRSRLGRAVLYPNVYVWYVFLATLDILITYLIIHPDAFGSDVLTEIFAHDPTAVQPRGYEVNILADWVIRLGGLPGMVVFKFALVFLVITICEVVGRRKEHVGRRLAQWAVAITVIPVLVGLYQLFRDVLPWIGV